MGESNLDVKEGRRALLNGVTLLGGIEQSPPESCKSSWRLSVLAKQGDDGWWTCTISRFRLGRRLWNRLQWVVTSHFHVDPQSYGLQLECNWHKVLVGDFIHMTVYHMCVFVHVSWYWPAPTAPWGDNHVDFSIVVVLKLKSMRLPAASWGILLKTCWRRMMTVFEKCYPPWN